MKPHNFAELQNCFSKMKKIGAVLIDFPFENANDSTFSHFQHSLARKLQNNFAKQKIENSTVKKIQIDVWRGIHELGLERCIATLIGYIIS
jgi:hypothetical protein